MRTDAAPVRCPNCRQHMEPQEFARRDGGVVRIDLCFPCHAIWFDQWESVQLAPEAIIELFKEIHGHRDEARQSLGSILGCPRCATNLALTNDLCKTGAFSYYRCAHQHGRFTPFFQFLREKQFVRTLTPAELGQVRAQIKEVRCSGCGAAVDLEKSTKCNYCEAPIAVLDADAVEKAMQFWAKATHQHRQANAENLSQALEPVNPIARQGRNARGFATETSVVDGFDLLYLGIEVVGTIFKTFTDGD